MRALFVLTPTESKRLIARAVVEMEEVKHALRHTNVMISHGSTCVYVLGEIVGKEKLLEMMNPAAYLSGIITRGTLCSTVAGEKPPIALFKEGAIAPPAATMSDMLRDFGADSVIMKGANAVDTKGNAAVMVAHPEGGTIGWSIGSILSRGIRLIVPVGLEKLVPSIKQSVALCGQYTLDYCQGKKVGMIPLSNAIVVTEIKALKILTGVDAFHVASGGVSGSEGSVTLIAEGDQEPINKAIKIIESIKGEQPLNFRKGICESCVMFSPAQSKDYDASFYPVYCQFQWKKEEELPHYLRNR